MIPDGVRVFSHIMTFMVLHTGTYRLLARRILYYKHPETAMDETLITLFLLRFYVELAHHRL